ncbi:unnamed protein product [Camellia sinensis]
MGWGSNGSKVVFPPKCDARGTHVFWLGYQTNENEK